MFCRNCGKEVLDTNKFCMHCGTPTQIPSSSEQVTPVTDDHEVVETKSDDTVPLNEVQVEEQKIVLNSVADSNVETIKTVENHADNDSAVGNQIVNENVVNQQVKAPKKSGKKVIIIVAIIGVLLIGGGVTGFLLYQNHINQQAVKVMTLFDENEYEESLELYEKYSDKKEAFKKDVSDELVSRAELVKADYLSEKIDYDTAITKLNAIKDYDDDDATDEVDKLTKWAKSIFDSRENYKQAKSLFEAGDLQGALEKYNLVDKADTAYYPKATKEIAEVETAILAEEQRIQEEERLNGIRDNALYDASNYEYYYDYSSAIATIEAALIEIPGDEVLLDKLSYYQSLNEMAVRVNNITSSQYSYTYQEGDVNLLIVNIELPILQGDSNTYDIINGVFDEFQAEYIAYNDTWAEELRPTATDEYFIPNSLDLTYTTSYNDKGIICFALEGYSYTGGAHGYPVRFTYIFDLATGARLSLRDLVSINETEFWSYVTAEFEKVISADPSLYWEDAMATVQSRELNYDTMDYYLTDGGIHVYYYPYDLGSYATGFVEAVIPYAGNEWMFNFLNNSLQ